MGDRIKSNNKYDKNDNKNKIGIETSDLSVQKEIVQDQRALAI